MAEWLRREIRNLLGLPAQVRVLSMSFLPNGLTIVLTRFGMSCDMPAKPIAGKKLERIGINLPVAKGEYFKHIDIILKYQS